MHLYFLTKWYILLPLAFSIGPMLSLANVDGMIHVFLYNLGGGSSYRNKNALTRVINEVLRGTPYWLGMSAFFNIFLVSGYSIPWIFFSLIFLIIIYTRFTEINDHLFQERGCNVKNSKGDKRGYDIF